MKVSVTRKHIDGASTHPADCPIARALNEAVSGHNLEFTVWDRVVIQQVIGHPGLAEEWELPTIIQEKIRKFDAGVGMEPFEFEFPIK